ncbi:hypothetical protein [Mycolicibacterium diernhoferi]|nr:hypothetical protein [Mycolicibacterium diernhoferi]QYL25852.1 hypothetical protein K0O62_24200 [Mycolicibacterium diernhoferi]
MEVDPEILRAFAGQVDVASGLIIEGDVGGNGGTDSGLVSTFEGIF